MPRRIEDREFAAVDAGSLRSNPCSPEFGDDDLDQRGIRIHAPTRVRFAAGNRDFRTGAFAHFVVCGACHFDSNYLGLGPATLDHLLFVAYEVGDRRVYAGHMEVVPNPAPRQRRPGAPPLTDADYAGRSVIKYFNPNMVTVLSLPEKSADYYVYATLGNYTSNVVRVALRQAD